MTKRSRLAKRTSYWFITGKTTITPGVSSITIVQVTQQSFKFRRTLLFVVAVRNSGSKFAKAQKLEYTAKWNENNSDPDPDKKVVKIRKSYHCNRATCITIVHYIGRNNYESAPGQRQGYQLPEISVNCGNEKT